MSAPQRMTIGVFVPAKVQLLDLSPIDLLAMLDPEYLQACKLPAPLISLGTPSTIHYISLPSFGAHVDLTAGAQIKISKTIDDPEVQPGKLDILLIPGPDPASVFEEAPLEFVRRHASWTGSNGKKVDILSVCTGIIILGQSGLLKGKNASGPRGIVPKLKKEFPDVLWIDDRRWVQDGNIWSSGGITNGQEMVAAYMRNKLPGPATEAVIAMADVGDKGVDYTRGRAFETVWWIFQIMKAGLMGSRKPKSA